MVDIRLSEVTERIAAAARRSGRHPSEVTLVVVTKYFPDEAVAAVVAAGARRLGENRATGLRRRAAAHPDVEWHFVGRLQSNKAKKVRPVAAVLHSMDRRSLLDAWSKPGESIPPVYVQVDLAGEPQKGGATPDDTPRLVEECVSRGVDVLGLMAIPPAEDEPEASRRWFAALRELRDRIASDHPAVTGLSMGMSADFEVAVEEGATVLRVGRAILGPSGRDED